MLQKKLIKYGLSEKEAKVYLALIEMGPSSAAEISRRSKVSRTNAYHVLDDLIQYGLVTSSGGESKTLFTAEDPDCLVRLMEERQEDAKRLYKDSVESLPVLKSLYNHPEKPVRLHYYEGAEGIIAAYEDTLTSKTKILGYASVEHQHSFFPGYFPSYYQRRTSRGIHVESFLADSEDTRRIKALDEKHLRITKLVPEEFGISPEINIYDDKVAIMSLKENFATIIESHEVAEAFRKMFRLAYERAEQYDKKLAK